MLKILVPKKQDVFRIAGDEFAALWKKSTGETLPVVTRDDGKSDLIVLGSDAVNAFTHAKIIEKVIPQFRIRTNTDDYQLISAKEGKRNLLFLAGGRARALLYSVYHFFESQADCHYFWDGDVIPAHRKIRMVRKPVRCISPCETRVQPVEGLLPPQGQELQSRDLNLHSLPLIQKLNHDQNGPEQQTDHCHTGGNCKCPVRIFSGDGELLPCRRLAGLLFCFEFRFRLGRCRFRGNGFFSGFLFRDRSFRSLFFHGGSLHRNGLFFHFIDGRGFRGSRRHHRSFQFHGACSRSRHTIDLDCLS